MKNALFWVINPSSYLTGDKLLLHCRVQPVTAVFEVFPAVTMKNAVFWDRKTQFGPHRKHITSPLRSPTG
jgi:hypothetical protein